MPHKHKRKRDDDKANFDLAPSTHARPLPAYKVPSVFTSDQNGPSNKRRKTGTSKSGIKVQDDTPKAFARMMAWKAAGKKPSTLDNGITKKPKKERKQPAKPPNEEEQATNPTKKGNTSSTTQPNHTNQTKATTTNPQILPSESLSQFAIRVDQTLPISSIPKSTSHNNNPNIPADIKPQPRLTKHNKRLQRMISEWRTTDLKLKEKREAESDEDELEDRKEEESLLWGDVDAARLDRKGKKMRRRNKQKGGGGGGEVDDDDDPWKELNKKRREETKMKNLQDVVKMPPDLKKVKKSKFRVTEEDLVGVDRRLSGGKKGRRMMNMNINDNEDGGFLGVDVKDVPNSVGSLRRREELSGTRRKIIDGYRAMAGRKRLVGGGNSGVGGGMGRELMT